MELAPKKARRVLLRVERFLRLDELRARIERSGGSGVSTRRLWETGSYEDVVGRSAPMLEVFRAVERLRDQEVPVLITGETGTGKELVARAIYRRSPRSSGPFQVVHCAALPEELFETELFGHERGAFTGADEERPGLLEEARGGTFLFDEVADLTMRAQGKLLQLLDTGGVRRVGGLERLPLDIRFLFTSSRDLARAVEERSFRRDLLYRLSGVEIRVPPLRERRDDIALLVRHLLERHVRRLGIAVPVIESAVVARLREAPWRGNVRELEGFLLRLLLGLPGSGAIAVADVEALLHRPEKSEAPSPLLHRRLEDWRADLERDYLTQLFLASEGNVRRMAEHLAVGRTALYGWFRKLGLNPPSLRKELRKRE